MSYALETTLTLHEHRCYECGRWWACEAPTIGQCPLCADARIARAVAEQARLERVVRSLRGAVTRVRGRR